MNDDGGGASRSTEPAAGTSTATDVSLREFFQALRQTDQAHTRERLMWVVGVGTIIWFEIQRRLEILNHENARLLKQQESSVSADTYKANEEQRKDEAANLNEWRKAVDADRSRTITREEFQQDNRTQRRGALASGTSLAGLAVAVLVAILLLLTYVAARHTHSAPTPATTVTVTTPTR